MRSVTLRSNCRIEEQRQIAVFIPTPALLPGWKGRDSRLQSTALAIPCSFSSSASPIFLGILIDVRGKLKCNTCHQICETCCEGGRR